MKLKDKGVRISLLALLLVMITVVVSLVVGNYTLDSESNFVGLGDQRSPYLIETAEDLCRFRDLVNEGTRFDGRFVLQTADIDLSGIENFTPIGTGEACFAGTYNGAGHTIYNLTITETEPQLDEDGKIIPTALFAQTSGAVQNLNLSGAVITGTKVGGIVGNAIGEGTWITNCYSDATLNGTECAGGIAVSCEGNIGTCIYTGTLSAPAAGGICAEEGRSVVNCVASSIAPVELAVKYQANNCTEPLSDEEIAARRAVMKARTSELANSYEQFYYAMFEGHGSQHDPFLISRYSDICLLRDLVNAGYSFDGFCVKQTADIDLSAAPWTPIGFYFEEEPEEALPGEKTNEPEVIRHYFWGNYDGAGHVISGLNVTVAEDEVGGFFSTLCGTVMNLGIESGTVEGGFVGSIAGKGGSDRVMIFNCYSKADVVGIERAGGIIEDLSAGFIGNCYFAGSVQAPEFGGVVGGSGAWLCNCYAVGYESNPYFFGYAKGERLRVDTVEEAVKQANGSLYNSAVTFSMQKYTLYRFDENGGFDGTASLTVPAILRQVAISLLIVIVGVAALLACYFWYHDKKPSVACCRALLQERWQPWSRQKLSLLVCGLFGVCMLLTFSGLLSGDTLISSSYVWARGDDALMDLFNPMKSQIRTNYWGVGFYSDVGETYPPLARALVWVLAQLFPFDVMRQNSYAIRTSSFGVLLAFFLAAAVCALLFLVWSKQLKDVRGRYFLPLAILTCPAFVFGLERYNLVLFAFLLIVLFLAGYRSENNFIRNMAYCCLALATALKIYPVVLALLILREKNMKHILQCAAWGIGVFLIPFAFCGGYSAIFQYIRNVGTSFTRYAGAWDDGVINFSNTMMLLTQMFTGDAVLGGSISGYILYPLTMLLAVCGLLTRKRWKAMLAATLILVLFPGFSVYYMAIFYALPLLALMTEKKFERLDFVYAGLLSVTILPLGFLCGAVGCGQIFMIQTASVIGVVIAVLLCVDFAVEFFREKLWRLPRRDVAAD